MYSHGAALALVNPNKDRRVKMGFGHMASDIVTRVRDKQAKIREISCALRMAEKKLQRAEAKIRIVERLMETQAQRHR